jgi:branched-chain amino acid transport system substrate-binding protein
LDQFYKQYETIKGSAPESIFAALGADAVAVIDAAVTAADSTDGAAVRDAIASLKDVQGATGPLTYQGQNGVPLKNVYLVTVKDGQFALIEQEVPTNVPAP